MPVFQKTTIVLNWHHTILKHESTKTYHFIKSSTFSLIHVSSVKYLLNSVKNLYMLQIPNQNPEFILKSELQQSGFTVIAQFRWKCFLVLKYNLIFVNFNDIKLFWNIILSWTSLESPHLDLDFQAFWSQITLNKQ